MHAKSSQVISMSAVSMPPRLSPVTEFAPVMRGGGVISSGPVSMRIAGAPELTCMLSAPGAASIELSPAHRAKVGQQQPESFRPAYGW
jgi:hypothetical protein